MALIPYPDLETLPEDARRIVETSSLNIIRMMAGSGALFEPLTKLALTFLKQGILPATLREAVTCRIAIRYNGAYVLEQHSVMARRVGLSEAQIDALNGPLPSPVYNDRDNAALLLIDAQINAIRPPDALVWNAYELLGETAFHELLLVAGFYHLAVRYTEAIGIDSEAATQGSLPNNHIHPEKISI